MSGDFKAEFAARFRRPPRVFQAPGRVNLIGEHTDYNDGYVMPAAIGFHTLVGCAPNNGENFVVRSLQQADSAAFPIGDPHPQPRHDWTDYVRGVQIQLQASGFRFAAANLLVSGNIPMGAGLSSSAAIEVGVALALLDLAGGAMGRTAIATLCQRAENEFVGARCGIMDQFSSIYGRTGHALLVDCRSLEFRYVALPDRVSLVICNSMVKHSHKAGEYNVRRAECERSVGYFQAWHPAISALRDVTEEDLRRHGDGLPAVLLRRSRHVISENVRVLRAADALDRGDLESMGKLMHESHISLRDDYEVSCPELDALVELAAKSPASYGARMTGGGFGGSTINLVEREGVDEFKSVVAKGYKNLMSIEPEIYVTTAVDGAGSVE